MFKLKNTQRPKIKIIGESQPSGCGIVQRKKVVVGQYRKNFRLFSYEYRV